MFFGDPEDFGNAGVDAKVSITPVEIALARFAGIRRTDVGYGGNLAFEGVGLAAAVVRVAAGWNRCGGDVPALVGPVGVPSQAVDRAEGKSACPMGQAG